MFDCSLNVEVEFLLPPFSFLGIVADLARLSRVSSWSCVKQRAVLYITLAMKNIYTTSHRREYCLMAL